MRLIGFATVCLLLAPPASAQVAVKAAGIPASIRGVVDVAASTLPNGPTPAVPAPVSGQISTGCSSQPITHDAAIWSVIIYGVAVPSGAVAPPNMSFYSLPAFPGQVFVTMIDEAKVPPIRIQLRDKVFTSAVSTNFGQLIISFGPMTLAEVSEFLGALEKTTSVTTALSAATFQAQVYEFTDKVAGRPVDQFYANELAPLLGSNPSPAAAATAYAGKSPAVSPASLGLTLDAATVPAAKNVVRIVTGGAPETAAQGKPMFIIDEPCLQFSVSPLATGGDNVKTPVSFRARYDFYNPAGTGFLKLRAEGDGAPSGNYYDRLEGTLDLGVNRKASRSILSFSGAVGYSLKEVEGDRKEAWRAVGKLQAQLPNLAGVLGALEGSGTSPMIALEFGGSGGSALTEGESWLARGTLAFSARFTNRLTLDLKGAAARAGALQFAGKNHYKYVSGQIRLNVNKDWDYLIKYECGEKDPDFTHYCGTQSGLALALGR